MPTPNEERPDAAACEPSPEGFAAELAPIDAALAARRAAGMAARVNGLFPSIKNQKLFPWSSRGQRDLMPLLEVNPNVLQYEQPDQVVRFVLAGRQRLHVPAFRVRTRRGPVIVDVRRRDEDGKPPGQAPFAAALAEIYGARGIPYLSLSRPEIRTQPRFGNADWVAVRSAQPPGDGERLAVIAALTPGARSFAQLARALPQLRDPVGAACAMAVAGALSVDLSAPAPEEMRVSLRAGGGAR